jgi:hypothetical protein
VLCAIPEALLHANSAAKPMGAFTAQSRQRKPTILTLRWWSETAGCAMKGQKGNRDRWPCSPTAECQTKLDLSVRSAIFPIRRNEAQRNAAVGKWPCSRLMLMPWPGGASRPYCLSSATGEASRRIADDLPASNDSWVIACWPDEVTRPYCCLADMRSVAASLYFSRLALAPVGHQANPQRSQGSPARAAKRRGACRTCHLFGRARFVS